MKLITEKEYRDHLKFNNELHELIEEKTKELSLIQFDRLPKGDYKECEFIEGNGKLFVEFEYYQCGENCYDQYDLPLEFLFDESYPEKYKVIYQGETRKKQEEKEKKKKEMEKERKRLLELNEKKEYERLKSKFENSNPISYKNRCTRIYDGKKCGGELFLESRLPDLDRTLLYRCKKCNEITEYI